MAVAYDLVVNLRGNMTNFSAQMGKARAEIAKTNDAINAGNRSMKPFYDTQARAANRSYIEQQFRDSKADKIKAMRAAALNMDVERQVQESLFGIAPPPRGPLRSVNRTFIEQQTRDLAAAQIRAMRNAATQHNIKENVQTYLFGGPQALGDAENAGKTLANATGKGWMYELNAMLGKRSFFGKLLKIAAGGGAVGAAGMAAKEFNELTKKAEDLVLAMSKGPEETKAMAAELLKSIPIVGKLGEGFARIWELLSGTTQYVVALTEATRQQDLITQAMKLQLGLRAEYKRISEGGAEDRETRRLREFYSGNKRAGSDIILGAREESKGIQDSFKNALAGNDEYKKLKAEADALELQIKKMPGEVLKQRVAVAGGGASVDIMMANPEKITAEANLKSLRGRIGAISSDNTAAMNEELRKSQVQNWGDFTDSMRLGWTGAKKMYGEMRRNAWEEAKKVADANKQAGMDALNEWMDADANAAYNLWESSRTPLEKYERKIKDLGQAAKDGTIDFETYYRLQAMAADEYGVFDGKAKSIKAKSIKGEVVSLNNNMLNRPTFTATSVEDEQKKHTTQFQLMIEALNVMKISLGLS